MKETLVVKSMNLSKDGSDRGIDAEKAFSSSSYLQLSDLKTPKTT